jgi:hypothetical protein
MGILERVIEMQQQGMPDGEIINSLRNEGIQPKEINDSIAQARIKMAVSQEASAPEGYQESAPQQYIEPLPEQEALQQNYPQYSEAPQAYSNQGAYLEQGGMSVETISEIVDRIVSEKIREINSKIKSVSDFKTKTEEEINEIKDRVKRIELSMDNLQRAVISKVGEVGQSNVLVHKDLDNLHNTVSKLMNPLIDNYNEMKKLNSK